MTQTSFPDMATEFCKIDFSKIEASEKELSTDREKALEFARDPDAYMLNKLAGSYIPAGLHFHVKLDNDVFPPDTQVPESQITFSSAIEFAREFREEVLAEIRTRVSKHTTRPLYCEGCGYCKIVIVK